MGVKNISLVIGVKGMSGLSIRTVCTDGKGRFHMYTVGKFHV